MTLDDDLERIAIHYYPRRRLEGPTADSSIRWQHDPDFRRMQKLVRDLEKLQVGVKQGALGDLAISEEWVIGDQLHLQLSYLGPYAVLRHDEVRPLDEDLCRLYEAVERVLAAHQVRVLAKDELDAPLPWFQAEDVTVWRCLFVHPGSP